MLSLQNHCLLVFLVLFTFCFHPDLTSSTPSAAIPHPEQCHALLQFKSDFVINAHTSNDCYFYYEAPHPKTESWKEDTDCCSSWDGVTCDGESSHVIGLELGCSQLQGTIHSNSTLFSSHLAPYLQNLNLSHSGFNGNVPIEISYLSNLVSLDLSYNYDSGLRVESDRVVERIAQNLTQLRALSLDGVNMSSVHASSLMNLSSSLTSLTLRYCQLQGQFPTSILLQSNLQELDLAANNFIFLTSLPHFKLTTTPSNNLTLLFLTRTDLSTSTGFLDFVGNHFKSLRRLYLDNCNINGSIPPSFGNLIELTILYLQDNHLSGPIPPSLGNFTNLVRLYIEDNHLNGPLPSDLFALPSLEEVDLSHNNLHGQIPTSPFNSMNLTTLDLSNNNLSGSLDFDVFLTLNKLRYLDLSNNNITSSPSVYTNLTYSLPSFELLGLSGCKLNQFPTFIKALTNLSELDVSNNQIQGPIPEWIFDVGKDTLYNINFRSNLLQGEISSAICNLSNPLSFDLSHNQITGSIPQCLGNLSSLETLNLGMNNLQGRIPNTFAKHNSLNSLVMKGNQLTGTIPQTLSYCQNLEILDVGNNMIEDTVPHWLETLSSLKVLVLRSNKFYGSLNSFKDKLLFPALRILDLSNNNFVGQFPFKLIKNLNAITKGDGRLGDGLLYMRDPSSWEEYYSLTIIVKGSEMEYVKILTTLATIDLSRNKFEGHIPKVIGKLISLKGLNLSHNLLTGHIPSSIGDLGSLEWLDLSHNQLSGQIPRELTDLNFLQVLDLSSNQLDGAVPQGKQFNTFSNGSYKDNLALCGFPFAEACGPNHEPPSNTYEDKSSSDSEGGFSWEGAFAGYGCGIVFGMSIGYLVFKTRSPEWFVSMFEGKQRGRISKRSKRRVRTRN